MNFCTFPGQKWEPLRSKPAPHVPQPATSTRTNYPRAYPPEPPPKRTMKILFFITLAAIVAFFTFGCVTTTETKYHADGSKSVIERKEADRAVLTFGGEVIRAYSPRAIDRSGK